MEQAGVSADTAATRRSSLGTALGTLHAQVGVSRSNIVPTDAIQQNLSGHERMPGRFIVVSVNRGSWEREGEAEEEWREFKLSPSAPRDTEPRVLDPPALVSANLR